VLELADVGDFIADSLALGVSSEQERLESGLAALAAVGSTAPFVGLLGTVWGIYHALIAIGVAGQGSLDKVAGPVGEALVMTALGLAVAIPAVLAYNAFVRATRRAAGELQAFAHEMLAFLATGVPADAAAQPSAVAVAAMPAASC
jgi:biopolymer transport protein ExbB